MTSRSIARGTAAVAASVLIAGVASGLAAQPGSARGKQQITFNGFGDYQQSADGTVAVAGTATGRPYDGAFTAVLAPTDRLLPAPGECEPATATMRLDGSRDRYVVLDTDAGVGEVCGTWTSPTNGVTHVFTGRYRVNHSDSRRLRGSDGWYEIRLSQSGGATVTAVDT